VKGGDYASASEVVRAGLRARESGMKRSNAGCRKEVAPVHEAMKADHSRAISVDDAFGAVRARNTERPLVSTSC